MLAIRNTEGVVAVDCGADLVQKMLYGGIGVNELEGIVLTHNHPDHITGFPLVMQRLWLHGRTKPLRVFGPESTLRTTQKIWDAFDLEDQDGMPKIEWNSVTMSKTGQRLPLTSWIVDYASATHGPDTIGLRFEDRKSGCVFAYSSDTEPSVVITRLASGADILVHEATGEFPGHSSIRDAASVARDAGARRLLLVHLPRADQIPGDLVTEARHIFPGLEFGEEGGVYSV